MSLRELQEEARTLDGASRRRLMAFLVALEDGADDSYRREMAARINDQNPESWISLEEAKQRLEADE
jgi:hypothetical protein